ncbi:alpha/beta fold hydrolase [Micromonospora sp. NPDC048930]|uniref:alpha/beta fold hydrolase n=1 Tax=Micromonospora sp. NPDC048930 TaxID=3364261 RepID=UPI003719C4BF
MVPALAGHHHVIRIDLPGCGQSSPAPSYDVPAQANRVAAVLDDLGLRRVAVAGHSSGGYGTALAEQRPDLVASLSLISTGPSLDALLPQPVILRVPAEPAARPAHLVDTVGRVDPQRGKRDGRSPGDPSMEVCPALPL